MLNFFGELYEQSNLGVRSQPLTTFGVRNEIS